MSARALLAPLTPLYRLGLAWRERRLGSGREPVRRLTWPVVSVGNLSTGGAGKTPLTIALAQALTRRGVRVDVLSRGYGRRDMAAALVRTDGTAEEFGDEPLLMARVAGVPVYVAAERYEAGLLAERNGGKGGAAMHILDDGFQHRQLHREVDILLLNRDDWHGRLMPAGNLREARRAAARTSVIAVPADDAEFERELRAWGWAGPVWRLRRRMETPEVAGPVVAFCGIARPEQFFAGLEALGVRLAARIVFRDHHVYRERDVERLRTMALRAGATLLTTEKDAVRMSASASGLGLRTTRLRTEIEDEAAAAEWLLERIRVAPGDSAL